jgi:hypothetical protein
MENIKNYLFYDMQNQRKEIIDYYEELRKQEINISLDAAAIDWICKFAYSWRIAHKIIT